MKRILLVFVGMLTPGISCAQPVVDSVLHSASYSLRGTANWGIPRGAIFTVFGRDLGPSGFKQVSAFPLGTEMDGITVQVKIGNTTINAVPISRASVPLNGPATQISAIMPSAAPTGDGQLTVSYNGKKSGPIAVRVIENGFGMYTLNSGGSGPAVITDTNYQVNLINQAAKPGQLLFLWGTGLGAVSYDEFAGPPRIEDLPYDVRVFVGGREAKVSYKGRSGCCAGLDQILFEVPSGAEGCFVPVAVMVRGSWTHFATMSITSSGKACSDPGGMAAADVERTMAAGEAKFGAINLGRVYSKIGTAEVSVDQASASFFRRSALEMLAGLGGVQVSSVPGACMVFTIRAQDEAQWFPSDPAPARTLDAGPFVNVTGTQGSKQISLVSKGIYSSTLGGSQPGGQPLPDFLVPGDYKVDNGSGGADIGPFEARVTIPPAFAWTNRDGISDVDRGQDLTLTWNGGDPAKQAVTIVGASLSGSIVGSFVCTERAATGTFTVPKSILRAIPSGSSPVAHLPSGLLAVGVQPSPELTRFSATGLDAANIQYTIQHIKGVTFR